METALVGHGDAHTATWGAAGNCFSLSGCRRVELLTGTERYRVL
ncbi:hypothetical protein HSR122_2124 [Halapricum desulfuricans]|uniref:Uncharacterized protein n=1 Tax=Halapricum desulfuricans TaxID=2841257 RepID=A0A897NAU4_9EURY|nr:hypothetical protein HSR122_2124 [Halapricum desulfuricans]